MSRTSPFLRIVAFAALLLIPVSLKAGELPPWLEDRGPGIPSSMFGTCILKHQLLIYPFYEYYVDHDLEYSPAELGEYAVEFLNRVSSKWRLYLGVEGLQDELELIPEAQWHIRQDRIIVKLNSAFGITSRVTDWARSSRRAGREDSRVMRPPV